MSFRATSSISLERRVSGAVVKPSNACFDDQPDLGAQLGETRRRVQPDAMLALARSPTARPRRCARSERPESGSNERSCAIERAVAVCHQSRARKRAMTPSRLAAVPHEHAAGREHSRELAR